MITAPTAGLSQRRSWTLVPAMHWYPRDARTRLRSSSKHAWTRPSMNRAWREWPKDSHQRNKKDHGRSLYRHRYAVARVIAGNIPVKTESPVNYRWGIKQASQNQNIGLLSKVRTAIHAQNRPGVQFVQSSKKRLAWKTSKNSKFMQPINRGQFSKLFSGTIDGRLTTVLLALLIASLDTTKQFQAIISRWRRKPSCKKRSLLWSQWSNLHHCFIATFELACDTERMNEKAAKWFLPFFSYNARTTTLNDGLSAAAHIAPVLTSVSTVEPRAQ